MIMKVHTLKPDQFQDFVTETILASSTGERKQLVLITDFKKGIPNSNFIIRTYDALGEIHHTIKSDYLKDINIAIKIYNDIK